ncbi:hypothetical protein DLJ60_10265 [Micromonospora chalcea]|uniref:Uncharacterized protein n=1 Tax=Micromonospora chalcea TaxID=1874 RepID=A0ABX9Y5L2_MICCH|nr:hypothetical protein DLJ60_10265 [Micromonospora chalcea]
MWCWPVRTPHRHRCPRRQSNRSRRRRRPRRAPRRRPSRRRAGRRRRVAPRESRPPASAAG